MELEFSSHSPRSERRHLRRRTSSGLFWSWQEFRDTTIDQTPARLHLRFSTQPNNIIGTVLCSVFCVCSPGEQTQLSRPLICCVDRVLYTLLAAIAFRLRCQCAVAVAIGRTRSGSIAPMFLWTLCSSKFFQAKTRNERLGRKCLNRPKCMCRLWTFKRLRIEDDCLLA
ncbi:hypothetical protein ZHAS_00008167 [Anopheles sinensis]|uniref:Uncharacterized protein n=1 Tax=Anopheles sinensis TaxID=74873 RepID=A0A084VRP1_ANOSI|nr:hypothetical protein ZHAS_00008167 [Anopheles sinensis]